MHKAVVVYDEQTGAVQDIRQDFTWHGTPGPSQADILKRALVLASETAESDIKRPAPLQALALAQEDRATLRQATGPVKVDWSIRQLIPVCRLPVVSLCDTKANHTRHRPT